MYESYITVEVDTERGVIETFRVDVGGQKIIQTQYPIEKVAAAGFDVFAKQLGEDLIFCSPKLREIMKP